MSFISVREGACPRYYIYGSQLAQIDQYFLLTLFSIIVNSLKYYGLFKSTHSIDANMVLTAIAIHFCSWFIWAKTAVRGGLLSYDCRTV